MDLRDKLTEKTPISYIRKGNKYASAGKTTRSARTSDGGDG